MLKIVGRLVDLVLVPRCSGCHKLMDTRGITICKECYDRFEDAKTAYCDFCGMEASLCICVPQRLLMSGCSDYRKITFYKTDKEASAFRNMIFSIKRKYNLVLMRFFMQELSDLHADRDLQDPLVSYAPRTHKAYRKNGYDQAKLLAKFYAEENGYEFAKVLRRRFFHREKEQKLLNYSQRAANMRGAFAIVHPKNLVGRDIILVDDVVTSGSTVAECVSMLYAAGAKTDAVRSIAYTYKKNKYKKD